MKHQITYVVPTLNSDSTLESTLLSLKCQEQVDVKIIVVDGGSKDKTLDICHKWGVDSHYLPPGNMYKAINYGLKFCTTEWIAYLNSDDILYMNSLSELIQFGNRSKADVVYGNCDFIDINGRFMYSFSSPSPEQLISIMKMKTSGISQPTVIFRKELYEKLDGFDENFLYAGDYDFFFRAICTKATFSFFTDYPVACFRLHSSQFSKIKAKELREETNKTLHNNPTIIDFLTFYLWRFKNTSQYLLRILRKSFI